MKNRRTSRESWGVALASLSIEARKRAWGEVEFRNRMREWGKMGGRPKGSRTNKTKKGSK